MAARSFVSSISNFLEEDESLGERVNQLIKLKSAGFDVPPGFIVTADAFFEFIRKNNLSKKIKHLLNTVDLELPRSVKDTALYITKHLEESQIPEKVLKEIINEYKKMSGILHHGKVSVHLSQPNGVLKIEFVKGDSSLIHTIKSFWLNLFSNTHPNRNIIVQKVINGKTGRIRSSTKLIRTAYELTNKERENLENLVEKFKKEFYLPHEIDFVVKGDKTYILKITPETHVDSSFFPETNYKIIKNSHHLA